jgi:hypothetical protein
MSNKNKLKIGNGSLHDELTVASYMHDDLREQLHGDRRYNTPQKFYRAYCRLHKKVHGETFFLDTQNPQW